jgi:hypothetical protein
MDIDQNFRAFHAGETTKGRFRFGLNRLRNSRLVRSDRHLHDDAAAVDPDGFDQTERDDVATEAGIFNLLQSFLDLLFGDSHGRLSYGPTAREQTFPNEISLFKRDWPCLLCTPKGRSCTRTLSQLQTLIT